MRVTKKVRKPKRRKTEKNKGAYARELDQTPHFDGLVHFLNLDDFNVTDSMPEPLFKFLRFISIFGCAVTKENWRADPRRQAAAALKLLQPLQGTLIEKLSPFGELPAREPDLRPAYLARINRSLRELSDELTSRRFATLFHVTDLNYEEEIDKLQEAEFKRRVGRTGLAAYLRRQREKDLNRTHRIFSWLTGRWTIEPIFWPQRRDENPPEAFVYKIIADALVAGDLALLRRCGYCRKFFIAIDPRNRFCPGHMRLYYDDSGRAKLRVERSRARRAGDTLGRGREFRRSPRGLRR